MWAYTVGTSRMLLQKIEKKKKQGCTSISLWFLQLNKTDDSKDFIYNKL